MNAKKPLDEKKPWNIKYGLGQWLIFIYKSQTNFIQDFSLKNVELGLIFKYSSTTKLFVQTLINT